MLKHIGKFNLAYNQTENILKDLIESALQKIASDESLEEEYEKLRKYYKDRMQEANESNNWFFDLYRQVEGYKKSIKKHSHRVLIVAHSQRNLFTYQAYKILEMNSTTNWMTDYIYVVSVASPLSSDIIPNTPVICLDNDLVCKIGGHNGIKNNVRGVYWFCTEQDPENILKDLCDENVKNELSKHLYDYEVGKVYKKYKSTEHLSGLDKNFGIHAFSFYMGEPVQKEENVTDIDPFTGGCFINNTTKEMILSNIKQGLEILSKKPSMWELNTSEIKCGSCDEENIRISANHRFYRKNISDIKVFPFNTTNYKIYPIEGKYVAAKCGGEKIEQNWPDKTDNQCYKLTPINKIISKKQCNTLICLIYSRPEGSIYTSKIQMCKCNAQNGKTSKCITVANAPSGDGYKFWDVFNQGPCKGYNRYKDSNGLEQNMIVFLTI